MSSFPIDMYFMQSKYGFREAVAQMDPEKLKQLLEFRIAFLKEELTELEDNKDNPEEIVDALIDLTVVALGTLDLYDVDAQVAWDRVYEANMQKEVGIKPSRPNPLGLPDLIKPAGWEPPRHDDNHGLLTKMVKE